LPTYGADRFALVCGYVFSLDAAGRSIPTQEALEWLAREAQSTESDFLWLHFNLAHSGTEKWIRDHLALCETFRETLHDGSQSTRIEYADEKLIAVVNDVLFDFAFGASEISTLWLSVDALWIVLRRRRD
jgi:zinc transporter